MWLLDLSPGKTNNLLNDDEELRLAEAAAASNGRGSPRQMREPLIQMSSYDEDTGTENEEERRAREVVEVEQSLIHKMMEELKTRKKEYLQEGSPRLQPQMSLSPE